MKMKPQWIFLVLFCFLIGGQGLVGAQEKMPHSPIGWEDANHDGVNDRFADANGDGINDRTGKSYPHQFPFVDANKDGVNDLFKDVDGDGINDYGFHGKKTLWFLDANSDGLNDVTGKPFNVQEFKKQQLGLWDELHQRKRRPFVDKNGNGVDDRLEAAQLENKTPQIRRRYRHRLDRFIDEDGDGIADHRMGRLRLRPRKGNTGRGPGHGPGHP